MKFHALFAIDLVFAIVEIASAASIIRPRYADRKSVSSIRSHFPTHCQWMCRDERSSCVNAHSWSKPCVCDCQFVDIEKLLNAVK
ncbi:hypothetical protein TSAR_001950 [Trichomalopsis sarcophagae]|uniref:Uncharacterized protein n=1 Tax=Trichomalopsis sarcophagae TaxID=543379 RepID=A0A232FDV5_9HYME|nr:hypothetical protein TSAR_001950 [Trichomalopsis sarcophagae]